MRDNPTFPEPRSEEQHAEDNRAFEAWDEAGFTPLRPCPKCGLEHGLIYCENCHTRGKK